MSSVAIGKLLNKDTRWTLLLSATAALEYLHSAKKISQGTQWHYVCEGQLVNQSNWILRLSLGDVSLETAFAAQSFFDFNFGIDLSFICIQAKDSGIHHSNSLHCE